jgi:hypothetical protein
MKLKDHKNRRFEFGRLNLSACDVDEDNNIENIDIVVDGELKFCINIQRNSGTIDQYRIALASVFDCLTEEGIVK